MTPEEFIASRSAAVEPSAGAASLPEAFADQHEIVFEGWGNLRYGTGESQADRDLFCYIAPYANHVNLGFYRGALLSDPAGLLVGSGKLLRHVKINHVDRILTEPIRILLREARHERLPAG